MVGRDVRRGDLKNMQQLYATAYESSVLPIFRLQLMCSLQWPYKISL